MANQTYQYSEFRNINQPTQLQTRRWPIDAEGNRIGNIEILPGGADQYRNTGNVVSCVGNTEPEYTYASVANETTYTAYVEFRPKNQCGASPLYSSGFGIPPGSLVQIVPENIILQPYCLLFSTPGHRSRLVNEANQLIATTDGVTNTTVDNHVPINRYKVLIGIEIVSFSVRNNLPVVAEIFIRSAATGTTIRQTPAGGIQPGGSYIFANIDAISCQIELVATGMVNRPQRAQLVNNNNVILTSTGGDGIGRFPSFIPQGSPFGDLRIVEEGSIAVNDLQVAASTQSRYVGNQQQVVIFLTSASLNSIGPFRFRIQNVYTDAIIAIVESATYDLANGYVLNMPTPYSGEVRVRARALRGTVNDTSDDWEGIDRIITLFPNEATFIRKVGVKYEGVDGQGRQTVLLLVNSSYADSKFKWDGFSTNFVSMIQTTDYPGYTHYVRLFGELNRATFDFNQTFNIRPKNAADEILTLTYVRGNDTPGTTKVIFGSDDVSTVSPAVLSIDGRMVTITDNTDPGGGGGGTSNDVSNLANQVYGNTLHIGWQTNSQLLNVGIQNVLNGRVELRNVTMPGPVNGYIWADIINEDDNNGNYYTSFSGLAWPVGFPILIKRYLIPNGQTGVNGRENAISGAEMSVIVY